MTDAQDPTPDAPASSTAPVSEPPEELPSEPDWKTEYKYLLAEFDNFRKRTEREREQRGRDARALVLRELLPLFDALTQASESTRSLPETDSVRRGFELLQKEWNRFLDREEVAALARVGELFKPDSMEAVAEEPASKTFPDGTVSEVVQQGYSTMGRLLRPARVVVARAPPPTPSGSPAEKEPEGDPP